MRLNVIILVFAVLVFASVTSFGQPPDNTPAALAKSEEINKPKGFLETMQKMRIEQEKKEYKEMMGRSEQALRLSEQLEKSFSQNGRLTKQNYDQIASIEKLTKKIRNELGGDDDDDRSDQPTISEADAVKTLRERVVNLYDALKKTSRFSISAAAIEGTNAVLKIARFFRITK
ncbi:MAG: hypothetical protein WBD16_09665 [Pyrinomonadaceae bacterium]